MIQRNNNTSVLPWYESIAEQNHRKTYAYGQIYPLFTPANTLLPFQIVRPARANDVTNVTIFNKDGTVFADVTQMMMETGLQVVKFPDLGYDVIVYTAILPLQTTQPEGIYYAKLTDGEQTWYSELYTVVSDVSCYLKLEWYDLENLEMEGGQIVYRNPSFRNKLYLSTQLGKPEYIFEEEGEDRDGYFFPEKQISEKTYRCTILAPEYLCDVMRFIRMADYVTIKDHYGRIYNCDTFLITPKWETNGDLASVEIEFQTDTVVKKIGKGVIVGTKGDFNEDFNNDFN